MDRQSIAHLDTQNMLGSIEVFQKQCEEAWESSQSLEIPEGYRDIDAVLFVGMGGSALGIDVIKTLFAQELRVPVTVVNNYNLPGSITERTLVVFSSYSGTTEEVVAAYDHVVGRTQMIAIITTGGTLQEIAERDNIPAYIFHPTYNPSNQPRMAVGYSVVGTLGLFAKLGLIQLSQLDIQNVSAHIESLHTKWGIDVADEQNEAKKIAKALLNTLPVYISSEHLEGAVHVATNQMNENAKTFATRFILPEMNHHLIEAFRFPENEISKISFFCFESALYHERNQKRYAVTEELAGKHGIQVVSAKMQGSSIFLQAFEAMLLGAYVSFYTAMLLEIDPSPIPNVNYLKEALK